MAKNNYQIFNSSEILKKYINEDEQNDNDICITEINKKCIDNISRRLSTLKNKEYIIFKMPEERETTTGKAKLLWNV